MSKMSMIDNNIYHLISLKVMIFKCIKRTEAVFDYLTVLVMNQRTRWNLALLLRFLITRPSELIFLRETYYEITSLHKIIFRKYYLTFLLKMIILPAPGAHDQKELTPGTATSYLLTIDTRIPHSPITAPSLALPPTRGRAALTGRSATRTVPLIPYLYYTSTQNHSEMPLFLLFFW